MPNATSASTKPRAAVFGAGNIGRGFIGQLFSESGYAVVFSDIDETLLRVFNTDHAYDLQTVYNDDIRTYRIGPVSAIDARDAVAVHALLLDVNLAATAVGVRVLTHLVPHFARAIDARAAAGAPPLNIILCENLKNAAAIVREQVSAAIAPESRAYFDSSVGFVDPVIGRMVPPTPADLRASNPALVRVEPYKALPVDRTGFRGPVPDIVGLEAHDHFPIYTARKLYIHNCGHALLAYAGHRRGFEYGYDAMDDAGIHAFLHRGWAESRAGIVHAYGADADWLTAHMADLDVRFRNQALGDTVFRLGKDPVRKLGPTDRLVAPALAAAAAGVSPVALATGIALALRFAPAEDEVALELQDKIKREGVAAVLASISGLAPDSALSRLVIQRYAALADPEAPLLP